MSLAEDLMLDDDLHPIDLVETLASDHQWEFDRVTDNQIAMAVEGMWRTYSLTLAWSPSDETLRLICTFDLDPPADRLPPVYETMNLANDQVWDGGFTFWSKQRLMVWRYGLVLAGDAVASAEQVDRMISNALLGCERFYPSFQLVAWGNSSPAAALDIALGEAYGRA